MARERLRQGEAVIAIDAPYTTKNRADDRADDAADGMAVDLTATSLTSKPPANPVCIEGWL